MYIQSITRNHCHVILQLMHAQTDALRVSMHMYLALVLGLYY